MNKRWYKKKHTYPVVCQWCSSPPETHQKLAENPPRLVFWKKTKLALSHTSMAVWCWCWCVSVAADHFFISYFGIRLEYIFMYWTKLLLLLFYNPFNRLCLSNNKHIIYVYQESHRTASNSDLASSSSSKLRHVCRHHHHSVLITSQAREK